MNELPLKTINRLTEAYKAEYGHDPTIEELNTLYTKERQRTGSMGGKAKVKKGFATKSKEEVQEMSRKAHAKRWGKRETHD